MPFPMKIQPINDDFPAKQDFKPVLKSRLKRLLDRPFKSSDKGVTEFEPSSVMLTKMVQNYMEENTNEKQPKNGLRRCNCFNGNNDSSDDDSYGYDSGDETDHFKSLIQCESVTEKKLLEETTKILKKNNKSVNQKHELKKIVINGLLLLGYDSSICKSKWNKSRTIPAGEYEYIDVIVRGERFIIDVDFWSEFEIVRQTSGYKDLIESLPLIFVGKSDKIRRIVAVVSEAAKRSLKKRGMFLPPWRKEDYMRAKWLSNSYTRVSEECSVVSNVDVVEQELVFEEKVLSRAVVDGNDDVVVAGLASLFKRKL